MENERSGEAKELDVKLKSVVQVSGEQTINVEEMIKILEYHNETAQMMGCPWGKTIHLWMREEFLRLKGSLNDKN